MGYMGFGMRKEDYQRKLKEVFSKIKMFQNLYAPSKKSQIKEGAIDIPEVKFKPYKKYKHLNETKLYKAFIIGIIVFLILFTCIIIIERLQSFF